MYTNGIRKIFTSESAIDINEARDQADTCGYRSLAFNGTIYVKDCRTDKWVATCFLTSDFTDKGL